ncbi:MAG TPA: TonB family protein [Pyrinomonadaceae bacterium]|nr:TonB family protein [Pyrinomonadaceae bacterium]
MLNTISRIASVALALTAFGATALAQSTLTAKANNFDTPSSGVVIESDRIRDGLVGPVRRVRTSIAKLSSESGRPVEGKQAVLEIVAYDIKGNKTENQYFPVTGANLTGKEVYKYDEKGNISEMTLVSGDGALISKEIYKYEFDFAGNWNKMTTSVAVIDSGKMSFEQTEVTYRSIMYYLDENMMKMAQAAAPPATSNLPANSTANVGVDSKAPANSGQPSPVNSAKKTSPALPESKVSSDQLKGLGSVEGATTKANTRVQTAAVQLESEPPPPPAPRPILKPVSGGVLNGTAVSLPAPLYPETARRMRVAGVVIVDVVVDETGKVISAQATSGPPTLRDVAVQAAMRARFSPTKLSGQPVKVAGSINYKFALAQ